MKQILDSYCIVDHESGLEKIRFESWITNQANFQRYNLISGVQQILTNLHESLVLYAVQILKNKAQIQICKSESMNLFWILIDESNLFSNYPYCGFDSGTCFQKICFVDLICKARNTKMLDLYQFVGIHRRIPWP
jgi:hypothetical protein